MESTSWTVKQINQCNTDPVDNVIQLKNNSGSNSRSKAEKESDYMNLVESIQNEGNKEVEHRASIGTVTKNLQDRLPVLESMSPANYEELMEEFRSTFNQAADTSEQHAKEYVQKAGAIEAALAALAEYNRKAFEQLSKLTMEAIQAADAPNAMPGMDKIEAAEALVRKAKLLVETAEKQLEYSKQIGNVARPLALWRLDASKAVWEAQTALKLAECKYAEAKERGAGVILPKPANNTTARLPSERSEPNSLPSDDQKPKRPPAITFTKGQNASFRSFQSLSCNSDISIGSLTSSVFEEEIKHAQRMPIKFWPKHTYHSPDGKEICYIRAPKDCLRKKNCIKCSFSEPFATWPVIPGHNEVIGPFVSIQPRPKQKITMLPNEPWILGIPHSYGKVASKEVVLYMIESGPNGIEALAQENKKIKPTDLIGWRDLHTTDVVSGENHYLEVRLPKLCQMTFAPCARLKRDCAEIGRSGGRILCLSDPRVTMTVPPGALKVDLPFVLQIQHLDYGQLPPLKEQNKPLMNEFISCSPFVYLTCATKILFKPFTFTIPIPELQSPQNLAMSSTIMDRMTGDRCMGEEAQGGVTHKSSALTVYDGFQKSLILPQLLGGQRSEEFEIALMKKPLGLNSQWKVWTDARHVGCDGDVITFNVNQIESCRLLALKIRTACETEVLCRCAALLEGSLLQHLVYVALRQHQKYPQQFYLILALADQLENALQSVEEDGYTEGDKPHGPVFLREHQTLEVLFRSNIRLVEHRESSKGKRSELKITFNPAMINRFKFTVEAIDPSAQIGLETYRGFLDIYCMREILTTSTSLRPPPFVIAETNNGPRSSTILPRSRKTRFQVTTKRTQLVRIVIKLPKTSIIPEAQMTVHNFEFQPNDVVTSKYLKDLASKLPGDMWRRLGMALNLSRSRIQAIGGKAAFGMEDHAYAMFITWIKTLPLSADRANTLRRALIAIGRNDLANELLDHARDETDTSTM